MKAFIFAAGLGTRLKPLTDTMPKALVPIGGKVLIDYLLDKLQQTRYIDDIIINVHHFAEQIRQHVFTLDLQNAVYFSDETDLLRETGGAIKYAEHLLIDDDPFLVHNSDVISNVNIEEMVDHFLDDDTALLLVSKRETSRYLLFDEERKLVGWTNVQTGEVKSPYGDIDPSKYIHLAFAGVHIISPSIFAMMDICPDKFSIIDFYLSVADKCTIRAYEPEGFEMVDVGKFGELEQATEAVKRILTK